MPIPVSKRASAHLALACAVKFPKDCTALLNRMLTMVCCLLALAAFAGCATTEVTSSQPLVNERLPRPNHIWVYDFAATPADVPPSSAFADPSYRPSQPQTSEEIAVGRQAGAEVAATLVEKIRDMGLPAERPSLQTRPQTNDLVIRGYFISLDEGSATQRIAIGFGSGSSQLSTAVEAYQMTARGLRKLGSARVDAGGNKVPGMELGVVGFIVTANPVGLIVGGGIKVYGEASGRSRVEGRAKATAKAIAGGLKPQFEQEGWIGDRLHQPSAGPSRPARWWTGSRAWQYRSKPECPRLRDRKPGWCRNSNPAKQHRSGRQACGV